MIKDKIKKVPQKISKDKIVKNMEITLGKVQSKMKNSIAFYQFSFLEKTADKKKISKLL